MPAKIDHLGVAVPSLQEGLLLYRDLLGLELAFEEEVATEKVRVAGLQAGDAIIELLEPTADDSAIARFLDHRGPGLHHIALEVADLDGLLPRLKKAGVRLLDEISRPGAQGTRVAFIHPKGALGVLIELVEKPGG